MTVWRAFVALGLTFKKRSTPPNATGRDRPDVAAARATWFARVAAAAPERLIFLDETWFSTAMGRAYGYAPPANGCTTPSPSAVGPRSPSWPA